jgi:hypothetical protein
MPAVSFARIKLGARYSRDDLALIWRYCSYHALARGVVTPQNDNKIILFVTENKKSDREQYADKLSGKRLEWEGPTDHFAEARMVQASRSGDEIHVFYRRWADCSFTYLGHGAVAGYEAMIAAPSRFVLNVQIGDDAL